MKILRASQIKELDQFTIQHEPIPSIDLMERAAQACVKRIIKLLDSEQTIYVVCGMGNNGGDGLAITRLLAENGFNVHAYLVHHSQTFSEDAKTNYERLRQKFPSKLTDVKKLNEFSESVQSKNAVVIDAIFGTGINKPVDGLAGEIIDCINSNFTQIISIDVPSGLFTDTSSAQNKHIVQSTLTLTFQLPKLAYLLADNQKFVPEFELLNIGLHSEGLEKQTTNYYYVTAADISPLLAKRNKFSHKGIYGHALLLAGSKGKSGAAVISAKACLRSGAGLFTVHSTRDTLQAISHHLPEAMSSEDSHSDFITEINKPENHEAIGFGPGVGLDQETQLVLKKILQYHNGKLVIDADGLNILSENKTWLEFLPPDTILTPHPKEFERLTEKHADDFDRLEALRKFSIRYRCIVVLKGAHSAVAMPDGNVFFNSTGNAGLAKAGSGDGLTGIILGLLSRGYNPPKAALIGTFVHGYAADLCARKKSMESMLITDVIEFLPKAFKKLGV